MCSACSARCGSSERRACTPSGMPSCSASTDAHGPAQTVTKYVASGGVVGQLGAAGRDHGRAAVAEHGPLRRGGDGDGVGRLEVGLVEAGEHRRARRRGTGGRRRSPRRRRGRCCGAGPGRRGCRPSWRRPRARCRRPGRSARVARRPGMPGRADGRSASPRAAPAAAGRRRSRRRGCGAVNRIVVRDPKVSLPRSRSRSTSIASTVMSAARVVASARVRTASPHPTRASATARALRTASHPGRVAGPAGGTPHWRQRRRRRTSPRRGSRR